MKKLLFAALILTLTAMGCATTDYPVITDVRGSFSGIIRTGHKAYQNPSAQVATIWSDGSDELFSMIYQNQYGDQNIYTFDNFDPTGSVNFLDQTYCDWRYNGCEIARAWNPSNSVMDNIFDYQYFPQCQGARSLSLLVSYTSRYNGECGDAFFPHRQSVAAEFANLGTTTWRGGTAYVIPVDSSNTTITLTNNTTTQTLPLFGSFNFFMTDQFQLMAPMTPNARHELRWFADFAAQYGKQANISLSYGSLTTTFPVAIAANGINYNLNRF